jgi:hypothetical protein
MPDSVRARPGRKSLVALLFALVATGLAVTAVAGSRGEAAPVSAEAQKVAALEARLAATELDAKFWQQLVQSFKPAKSMGLNSMADHRMLVLPSGLVLALHFDNMNLSKARNLNWFAVGIPGVFTQADKARVNRLYGPGINHFHDLKTDVHGGKRGVKGVWFAHIGVRNFTSMFGKVVQGKIDPRFMPTAPPK